MLELFVFQACPYCQKVLRALDDLELDYIVRTCHPGSDKYEQMVKLGGQRQVPYLVDRNANIAMYESDDIVNYLNQTYK